MTSRRHLSPGPVRHKYANLTADLTAFPKFSSMHPGVRGRLHVGDSAYESPYAFNAR
jgi:hypothetical protein